MIVSFFILLLTFMADILVAIMPDADFLPLPEGITGAFSLLGDFFATTSLILPDNTLTTLAEALTLVGVVNLFVLPWIAARKFRLPFAGSLKG